MELTENKKAEINNFIEELEKKFETSNDFILKLELKDKIHNYKMILNGTKPLSSEGYICDSCGS